MGRIKRVIIFIFLTIIFLNQQYYENYLDNLDFNKIINAEKEEWEFRLLFSRVENIYLVFYDKERKEIYVQFKEDRFDDRNDKLKLKFISGQPYRIKVKWVGIKKNHQFFSKDTKQIFKNDDLNNLIFIFQYLDSYPLVIDEILL
ncbi:MAG: hypothetical protein KatS3mg129_1428 [Leptospiraceae bacterium]|nr:MAG: hypothetical protein KatS3mg129_1428 [Leptospiraceae bacterium]